MKKFYFLLFLVFAIVGEIMAQSVRTGAERSELWLPMLENKRVALMVNQTSVVTRQQPAVTDPLRPKSNEPEFRHLADTLLDLGIDLKFIMSPEHGFKGDISAGAKINNTSYNKLIKMPIYSLYGDTKKPLPEWLDKVDAVVFDVQDVGCRFYTYLSTLYYVLEACGEQQKEVIVLDRPNPHDTIDGPVLDPQFTSFVGIVPVPILHGCTLGEMAQMMLGEFWADKPKPQLTVVPCEGWHHGDDWHVAIAPSPNLRNDHAIRLYPSLCLFEGTSISVGRGTPWPFEVYGHPVTSGSFKFTPRHNASAAHPLQENHLCNGYDLRKKDVKRGFHLGWLIQCSKQVGGRWITSRSFFDRLAGTDQLRIMIDGGKSGAEIRASWQEGLAAYREMRTKYVIDDYR